MPQNKAIARNGNDNSAMVRLGEPTQDQRHGRSGIVQVRFVHEFLFQLRSRKAA
jgi:hypothetical protein